MSAFAESVLFLAASSAFRTSAVENAKGTGLQKAESVVGTLLSIGCFVWSLVLIARWGLAL